MDYIFRTEPFGGLLYDIYEDKLYITNEAIYSEDNLRHDVFSSLNQGDHTLLPSNYFERKCGRFINSPHDNSMISAPSTVFFEVTKRCNLRCKHCFNSSGVVDDNELNIDEIQSFISDLASVGLFNVKVSGGEPFYRNDIFEILRLLEENSINYSLFTNGTLVSNDTVSKLKDYRHLQKVRVSIDGDEKTNNAIRGKGTYEKAMNTLAMLCTNKIPCELNYTITKSNYLQIETVAKDLMAKNIDCKIHIGMVKIAGRVTESDERYYFTEEDISNCIESVKSQIGQCVNIIPFHLLPPIYYKLFGDVFGCPAGKLTATIKSNGDVFSCGLLSGQEDQCCGNVRFHDFLKIWNSDQMNYIRTLPENSVCTSCPFYKQTCTGACRGNALNLSGDILGCDINCDYYKVDFNSLRGV